MIETQKTRSLILRCYTSILLFLARQSPERGAQDARTDGQTDARRRPTKPTAVAAGHQSAAAAPRTAAAPAGPAAAGTAASASAAPGPERPQQA